MKQRLLVMNSQRIVQHEEGGLWHNDKVDKARSVKPSIYNLYLAAPANENMSHKGIILHVDADSVYQQCGKNLIKHRLEYFAKVPEAGRTASVVYEEELDAGIVGTTVSLETIRHE